MAKLLYVFLLCLSFNLYAAPNGTHGLGVGGTIFKTWGLNYRTYFDRHFGLSANLGGWITNSFGNLGTALGGSYTLAHHKFDDSKTFPHSSIRVYIIAYIAGIYNHNFPPRTDSDVKAFSKHYFDLGFGIGPGAEFFFNRHFAIHAELPWMTFFRFSKNYNAFESSHPHFGGGVTYYF
jgi:hypothetical protein